MINKLTALMVLVFLLSCQNHSGSLEKENEREKQKHQPIVTELITLLKDQPQLKDALLESIKTADKLGVLTLPEYYMYLDEMVTLIPTTRNLLPNALEFYWLIDNSPEGILQKDPLFSAWTHKFIEDWGEFLNTPESASGLETFYSDPIYTIDEYYQDPSGWLTFNQFFSRSVRPGKRPVTGLCDDQIIVSAADSKYHGHWKISEDAEITVKGFKHSVLELLDGSPYLDKFRGGTFIHSYLSAHDYHRYHVPTSGIVKEIRTISGKVVLDVVKNDDGSYDMIDGTGYQLKQQRGLIVMETPIGYVATLPIGMGQVSSVNLTAEVGAELHKGEEFGFFMFGGSDIIILFEPGKVEITAEMDTHYHQGEQIARAIK